MLYLETRKLLHPLLLTRHSKFQVSTIYAAVETQATAKTINFYGGYRNKASRTQHRWFILPHLLFKPVVATTTGGAVSVSAGNKPVYIQHIVGTTIGPRRKTDACVHALALQFSILLVLWSFIEVFAPSGCANKKAAQLREKINSNLHTVCVYWLQILTFPQFLTSRFSSLGAHHQNLQCH